uniref:Lens intrinsic membrane protein 2 n=1 Tax=Hucho hucho TaxID=62062 RepID=A0A4W5JYF4_9TELE
RYRFLTPSSPPQYQYRCGLFCNMVGNILLVVSMGLYCMSGKCYMQTDSIAYWNATRAFMILSGMSCFTGIIAGILSFTHFSAFERFNRSFSILGWMALLMTFVAGIFYMCAYRMHECRRGGGPTR